MVENTVTEMRKILHEAGNYWVSNAATTKSPCYQVWRAGPTHSIVDSAYGDLSLAIARADYLARKG